MKMKVLLISQYYNPIKGAAARRAARWADYFIKRNFELTILTGFPSYPTGILPQIYRGRLWANEKERGAKILRVWEFPAPNKGIFRRTINNLSFLISATIAVFCLEKSDMVIITCPTFLSGIAGLLAKLIWHSRLYYNVGDLWPDSIIAMGLLKQPQMIKMMEKLERAYYFKSEKIFVISPSQKNHLIGEGILKNKIEILLNAADSRIFYPKKISRKNYGFKSDDFILCYEGNHSRLYDLRTVVRSASILQKYPKIKFIFIGNGETKDELIKLRDDLKLKNLLFLAEMELSQLAVYINLADLCLLPLTNNKITQEAMPAKTSEYLACAKPIIGAVSGEVKRLLVKNQAGLIYPSGDDKKLSEMILKLYRNPSMRTKMGKNARELALRVFSDQTFFKTLDRYFSNSLF